MGAGRAVVLTRTVEDDRALAELLASRGVAVWSRPCVAFETASFQVDRAHYDVGYFPSPRAVSSFFEQSAAPFDRCVAVGPSTRNALSDRGCVTSFPSSGAGEEAVIDDLDSLFAGARSVLVVEGDKATGRVARALSERGLEVSRVVAYRHLDVAPEPLPEGLDACCAVFSSPSAVDRFARISRSIRIDAVAIGETTARACRARGWSTTVANEPTPDALARCVTDVLAQGESR